MNKIFKVIFNRGTGQLTVVSEMARGNTKSIQSAQSKSSSRIKLKTPVTLVAMLSGTFFAGQALAANLVSGGTNVGTTSPACEWDKAGARLACAGGIVEDRSNNSIAIGRFATVGNNSQFSFALGDHATTGANTNSTVAIGQNATVSEGATNGFALGRNAKSLEANAIAIGPDVRAKNNGVAIGNQAKALGKSDSIAIGQTAVAEGQTGIAIGSNSKGKGARAIAIGDKAQSEGDSGTAISYNARAKGENSIAIGSNAKSEGGESIALGSDAGFMITAVPTTDGIPVDVLGTGAKTGKTVTYNSTINTIPHLTEVRATSVLGSSRTTSVGFSAGSGSINNNYGVNIGYAAGRNYNSYYGEGVSIGRAAGSVTNAVLKKNGTGSAVNFITGNTNTAISSNAGENTAGHNNVAVGFHAGGYNFGSNNLAIGAQAGRMVSNDMGLLASEYNITYNADGYAVLRDFSNTVALGNKATVEADNTIAIGKNTVAKGTNAIAQGMGAKALNADSIAIGAGAEALANNAISIGKGNIVRGENSGAIGDPTTITGSGTYTIGNNNGTVSANEAGAFGNNNTLTGNNSRIVGNSNAVAVENTFVVGNSVNATQGNSVVLGNESADRAATAVDTATVGGLNYGGFAGVGAPENGVVSVGKAGGERQIINVAAGEISETSTDAINGSQLYSVAQELDRRGYFHVNDGINANTGNATTNYGKYNEAGGATGANAIAAGVSAQASGNQSLSIGNGSQATNDQSIALGRDARSTERATLAIGSAAEATAQYANAFGYGSIAEGQASIAQGAFAAAYGNYSIAIGANATTAENVADAIAIGQSANAQGVSAVALGQGAVVSDTINSAVALGASSNADRSGFMSGVVGTSDTATFASREVYGLNSADDADKEAIKNTVQGKLGAVSVGKTDGTRQIINVAAGTENTDAVNVAQLKAVANVVEKGRVFAGDVQGDNASSNEFTQALGEQTNIKGGVTNEHNLSDGNIGVVSDGVDTLTVKLAKNLINLSSIAIKDGPTINGDGINMNDKPITGLVAGTNPTDAVNLSQLQAAQAAATTHFYSVNGVPARANYNNDGATGQDAMAAGVAASASGLRSTAIGFGSQADGESSIAIGENAVVLNNGTIGKPTKSIVIGSGSRTQSANSVVLGVGSEIGHENAIDNIIVGNASSVLTGDVQNTAVLGNAVQATQANSVILGNASADRAATEEDTATVNGLTYSGFAGQGSADKGVVSVGAKGKERQVINVAAGKIAKDSTDAINGSQLYATNKVLGNVADNVVKNFGGNATVDKDGNITFTNIGDTGETTIHDAIKAVKDSVSDNVANINKGLNFGADEGPDVNRKLGDTVAITGDNNITTQTVLGSGVQVTLNSDLDVDSVTTGDTVQNTDGITINNGNKGESVTLTKDGLNNGGNKIIGVANGDISAISKDAINGSQLFNQGEGVKNIIGGNTTYDPDKGTFTNTDIGGTGKNNINDAIASVNTASKAAKTEVTEGKNITVTESKATDGHTVYNVATADKVAFDEVNVGNVVINKDTGINAGDKVINGVKDGEIAADSKQAVNGSQLHNTAKSVADALGGGSTVNDNGEVTAPSYALEGTGGDKVTASNIGGALNFFTSQVVKPITFAGNEGAHTAQLGDTVKITGADSNITTKVEGNNVKIRLADNLNVKSVTSGNTVMNGDGVTINNPTDANKNVTLTANGLNNGGNRITNVAPGVADSDVATIGQVKGVAQQVNNNTQAINNLGNRMNNMDRKLKGGIAGNSAMASLPQAYIPGHSMVAVAGGHYSGKSAVALGVSRISDSGHVIIKLNAATNSSGGTNVGAGVGYQW